MVVLVVVVVVGPLAKVIVWWSFCGWAFIAANRVQGPKRPGQVCGAPPPVKFLVTVTLMGPNPPVPVVVKVARLSEQASVPSAPV